MRRVRAVARRASRAAALSGTNVARAGDHNQRVTLQAIRVAGAATRAEIAAVTGLTPAAVANITTRLVAAGLVAETGRVRSIRGKPSMRLAINPGARFSVGVHVDRDHVTMVLLDFAGRVRGRLSRELRFAGPAEVAVFVADGHARLVAEARIPRRRLVGCGIAFPDDLTRTVLPDQPAAYAEWATTPVGEVVGGALGLPVVVENDAAAAAIGELQFGAGQRYQSFFYLLVTAALGGGLVADGQYIRGATGRSGEIGWLRSTDATGGPAQLQRILSLSALAERLARHGIRLAAPSDLMALDPGGEAVVEAWIDEATRALEPALAVVNCLINPEAILVGGRLPAPLVDRLATNVNAAMARLAPTLPAVAPVVRATLADDAPAVGAAVLPFHERLLPSRYALFHAN
ncbi:MAG: ROK family transcriptional regulator [Proteobacteria bacterium]|nr:ROK family transcriptional regulator [Pseudomonadota bacterium]